MFAKDSGERGQTLQTQPVVHLESETKVVDVPQRLLSIHNSRSPFHFQKAVAKSSATGHTVTTTETSGKGGQSITKTHYIASLGVRLC
jgi:hypothetical protein